MNDQVVILGGSGYIGSHLVRYFCDLGQTVTYTSRRPQHNDLWNREAVLQPTPVTQYQMSKLVAEASVVIHLISPSQHDCERRPNEALEEVTHINNLLSHALLHRSTYVVYMSTIQVYGSQLFGSIEETSPIKCESTYAQLHLESERLLASTLENCGHVRLANAIGIPANLDSDCWGLLGNHLVRQAVRDGRLSISSDGFQHRSFIPIEDVVEGIGLITRTRSNGCLNLGDPTSHDVRWLMRVISDAYTEVTGRVLDTSPSLSESTNEAGGFFLRNQKLTALGFEPKLNHRDQIVKSLSTLLHEKNG